jgi:hypothetical protein
MERNVHGRLCALGFALWLTVAIFAATTLTAWHSVDLAQGSGRLKLSGDPGGTWRLTHYLSSNCRVHER